MKLLLTPFLIAYFCPVVFAVDYTTFPPGDYVFHGKVTCQNGQALPDYAYVRLLEYDPISMHDFIMETKFGKDGTFTVNVTKDNPAAEDSPTTDWELYLAFYETCAQAVQIPPVFSGFLKPDSANTGYTVKYTIREVSNFWNQWVADAEE